MASTLYILNAPLEVWSAPEGTAFPLVDAVPSGSWLKIGTAGVEDIAEGGVKIGLPQSVELFRTDGSSGPRAASRTEEDCIIEFAVVDMSVAGFAQQMNGATVVTVAAGVGVPGTKSVPLYRGVGRITPVALLLRGVSPEFAGGTEQYEIPCAIQSGEPEITYTKSGMAMLNFKYQALEDSAAATKAERFGRRKVQTAAATS